MTNASVGGLTSGLSLEQRRRLAVPLATAFASALRNVGLAELKEVAADKAWSIFVGYFGIYGQIFELGKAFISGEEGDFIEKLVDHFLEYLELDQFKEAYEVLQKLDNGRTAMTLAKDPAFKDVIGKLD